MAMPTNILPTERDLFIDHGYDPDRIIMARRPISAINLAIFIIACMGISGAFPGAKMGWASLGLVSSGLFLHFYALNISKVPSSATCVHLMTLAIIATLGALGGANILSAKQVGIAALVYTFNKNLLWCCLPKSKTEKVVLKAIKLESLLARAMLFDNKTYIHKFAIQGGSISEAIPLFRKDAPEMVPFLDEIQDWSRLQHACAIDASEDVKRLLNGCDTDTFNAAIASCPKENKSYQHLLAHDSKLRSIITTSYPNTAFPVVLKDLITEYILYPNRAGQVLTK